MKKTVSNRKIKKLYLQIWTYSVLVTGSILVFIVGIIIEWIRQYIEKNISFLLGRK